MNFKKGISVVIISYNSEKVIENTLKALFVQENTENINWEIIFVNNNSNDNTVNILNKLLIEYNFTNLKIVNEIKIGAANARFAGIKNAQFDKICYVDDDNRVDANWVFELDKIMQNTQIDILGCGGQGDFENSKPSWLLGNEDAYAIGNLYQTDDILEVTKDGNIPTAGMIFRTKIYFSLLELAWEPFLNGRVGENQVPGEDTEFCQAARLIGYKLFYTNKITFKHFMPQKRINQERFMTMTRGFGVSDVYLLPYILTYDKIHYKRNLKYLIRKNYLFNYLSKKIILQYYTLLFKLGLMSKFEFQKIQERIMGFCDTILQNKATFKSIFNKIDILYLNYLKSQNK